MFDVVALGELLIDFVCQSKNDAGYPTLAANPGGAPGNFLAALQAYGCTTAMLSKVGTDALGKLLVGTLENLGIHTRGIVMADDVFTTLAFVTLDNTGNREFSFARKPGADTRLTQAEVLSSGLIDDCRVFHFGTLSLTDEPVRTATCAAVARAKAQGKLISLDPNLRKPLWSSENEARRQIEWSLSQADIVKISDEEIDFLWGISPEEGARKLLSEYNVSLVYTTLGPKGCSRRQSQWFCYCRIAKGHPCRRYHRCRRHLRRQRHEPLPLAEQASRRTQRFRNDRNRALRLLCCEPFHANPRRHFERHSYGAGAGLRRKNL